MATESDRPADGGEALTERGQRMAQASELARLWERFGRADRGGARPADFALFKRQLSIAHGVLASLPQEGPFLSLVVMLEGLAAAHKSDEMGEDAVRLVTATLAPGTRDAPYTAGDFTAGLRELHDGGLRSGPEIEMTDDAPDNVAAAGVRV